MADFKYDYHYTIAGDPMPQARHRARYVPAKGSRKGFIHIYDETKCVREKEHIAALIKKSAPEELLDCPIQVDLIFHMPRPLSHFGTGKNRLNLKPGAPKRHTKKPDIDNLRKLLMDALTEVVWRDDSIVCVGTTTKLYSSDHPRTEVYIKILKESEEKTLWKNQEKQ